MNRLFLGTVAALALGVAGGAQASNTIQFDINGSAPGGVISVDTFDWTPDNALIVNGATPGTTQVQVVAQGSLGVFTLSGVPNVNTLPISGTEFTFQIDMQETVAGIGTNTVQLTPVSGTISIYYDAVADANQLAGTGYNDGQLILTASIVPGAGSTGTFTDFNALGPVPTTPLDNHNANNYPNVVSDSGNGSTKLDFHVTFADPNFFLSNITTLLIGMQDTSNNTTPFIQADPAAQVVGIAPVFTVNPAGGFVNGQPLLCGQLAQTRCDFLVQTDASTTFNTAAVPEPGTLALLSLGLLGAGVLGRRKMH
jgi:hypothetical protein